MNNLMTFHNGLYVSDDHGLTWQRKAISIDGKGVFQGGLSLSISSGLSVSPEDTVYLSFYGTATNSLVQLNLMSHTGDVWAEEKWGVYGIFETPNWWIDWPLNNIFFSASGCLYSSNNGNFRTGFTWYREEINDPWEQTDAGLGLSISGLREMQHFIENSSGRIFMVQSGDERIYTRQVQQDPVAIPGEHPEPVTELYPNPVIRDQEVILGGSYAEGSILTMYDHSGREIRVIPINGESIRFKAPGQPGIYYVRIATGSISGTGKLVVH
jgi:hypothetical protein